MSNIIPIKKPNAVFLKDNDPNYLVSQIEINDRCVTVYMRTNDDQKTLMGPTRDLIKAIDPEVTVHTPETRAEYHPHGKAKDHYKYFHHVHSPHDLDTTLKILGDNISPQLREVVKNYAR